MSEMFSVGASDACTVYRGCSTQVPACSAGDTPRVNAATMLAPGNVNAGGGWSRTGLENDALYPCAGSDSLVKSVAAAAAAAAYTATAAAAPGGAKMYTTSCCSNNDDAKACMCASFGRGAESGVSRITTDFCLPCIDAPLAEECERAGRDGGVGGPAWSKTMQPRRSVRCFATHAGSLQ